MALGMEFRRPKLREYTAPSSLCLCQHLPEVPPVRAAGHRSAQERA